MTVAKALTARKDQIKDALPRTMTPERMVRVTMTSLRKTPKLLECNISSLYGAIIQCAQLGLEPGITAHLVPFKGEVQFIPDYRGLIDLARRSKDVGALDAQVVRDGDKFAFQMGTDRFIHHVPQGADMGDESITHAYAICWTPSGELYTFDVMFREEIDKIRARSRATTGPWQTDFAAMAKKTVIRRLCKLLPVSVELQAAIQHDELNEAGVSQQNAAVFDSLGVDIPPEEFQTRSERAKARAAEATDQPATADELE